VVTAQKKGVGKRIQEVPIALTAFSGDQLERQHVLNVSDLSYSIPNVTIDGSGTQKGVAKFTIRGLGVTSPEPGLDPAVGTFADGVYTGVNYGVVLDAFDLESIEVLRGPRGLLIGRNVTGGAVLINTRLPDDEFAIHTRMSVETGLQEKVAASDEGAFVDGVLAAKLSAQYKDDDGFFENVTNGNDEFGTEEIYVARAAFLYTSMDDVEVVLRLETGDTDANGSINQNNALFNGQDVGLDNEGLQDIEWDSAILQLDYHVNFGDGTITNILGWRQVENTVAADLDSQPTVFGFDFLSLLDQDQPGNELRYTGIFFDERWSVTAGGDYFTQEVIYLENIVLRLINGVVLDGTVGANQDQSTWGIFTSNEITLSECLKLNLGVRYTEEEKDVEPARFIPSPVGNPETCALTTFVGFRG